MIIVRHLCGYDKTTDFIAVKYLIPEALVPKVRALIKPKRGDQDLALAYDIAPENTRTLASMLGVALDADAYDFTVESGYVPQSAQVRVSAA